MRQSRYRTGETYTHLVGWRGDRLMTALRRESDQQIIEPFSDMDDAERWIGHHGGGHMTWGSSGKIVPDRGPIGQIALLHFSNSGGQFRSHVSDWRFCEEHPRAFAQCGH